MKSRAACTEILATYIMLTWDESIVPLPSVTRNDPVLARGWRLDCAHSLTLLLKDEMARPDPSPRRLERRCLAYLKHLTDIVQTHNIAALLQPED